MSLEAKIEVLTAAIERLTAVLQSASIPAPHEAAADTAGTKPRTTRAKKDTQPAADGAASTGSPASDAADSSVNDGKKVSVKLRSGDPEGTRYFHIEAHRTVAAVKPGEVIPSIPNMVEIDGAQYDELKTGYTAPAATTGNADAATPAATTPSASTASSSTSAAAATSTAASVDGPAVVDLCKKLHARDGNDAIKGVLDHFKASKVGELVTKTAQLAEIAAYVNALLNPNAAAVAEPKVADLF